MSLLTRPAARRRRIPALPLLLVLLALVAVAGDEFAFHRQFLERARTAVAVQYEIQYETEREREEGFGLVLDADGLIVLGEESIPGWLPPAQLRDFKVFPPGHDGTGFSAEYLGQDFRTRWHYVRADPGVWDQLTPITQFGEGRVYPGSAVWGVHLLRREFNYEPAVSRTTVGIVRNMPLSTAFAAEEVGVFGAPVFNVDGDFAGWLQPGIPQEKILLMGRDSFNVGLQSTRGSTVFLTAAEFFKRAGRVPETVVGDRGPWIGVAGMEPLERSVAQVLGLEGQGAIVISDIIASSPAEKAGLRGRDIIIAINGEAMPRFSPPSILVRYFEDQLLGHSPGDVLRLTLMPGEGDEAREVEVTLAKAPKGPKEAGRKYFDGLGFSIREFVLVDGLNRRRLNMEFTGVIAQFIRPNSPADTARLSRGDWIREIDGREITGYDDAVEMLEAIAADENRTEFVLLIERFNETQVLQVRLD